MKSQNQMKWNENFIKWKKKQQKIDLFILI